MEEGIRRLTAADATLIAGVLAIIGTLLGGFLGLFGERVLRNRGRLWCETGAWEIRFVEPRALDGEGDILTDKDVDPGQEAHSAVYTLSVDLFNDKEIPTGLRNVHVVLVCGAGEYMSKPKDLGSPQRSEIFGVTHDPLGVLNLPPRQWVQKDIKGRFVSEDGGDLSRWRRAELVGMRHRRRLLEPKEYRRVVALEGASKSWWRRVFGG